MAQGKGKRESHWLVIRRCIAIIRRVQRGLADRDALIEAVLAQEGPEAYGGVQSTALHRRFDQDRKRVRENLGIDLYFDRRLGGYVIRDYWLPLLDLPDEDLATIAWLQETFDLESPQHDEVHALLDKLRLYLGPERSAAIERYRATLTVDLKPRDDDEIRPAVWSGLRKAWLEHRQAELLYVSPEYVDSLPRRHVVEIYDPPFLDTASGHYYLRAHCKYTGTPADRRDMNRYLTYRIGRIVEVTVLPQKLPSQRPSARQYVVEYELAARIACAGGVTRQPWIEIHAVERRSDGSVLVKGETESVFSAVRTLLHYGPNCRVVGGPEMVREMRSVVEEMARVYEED
jgi:predicted DNA-binding transcriptional regulator YafY